MATINETDLAYLRNHKVYFEQAKMNFLHGFNAHIMDTFHQIFQRYLQPGYVLTPWCSECVIDMVARLGAWYAQVQDDELIAVTAGADIVEARGTLFAVEAESITVKVAGNSLDAPKKRGKGRPKKSK